jgi:glutathione S-transferase
MRARLGLLLARQEIMVRAIKLTNKPAEMLAVSAKGTVPVLVVPSDGEVVKVIDESLEVMLWGLRNNDPQNLLYKDDVSALPNMLALINRYDTEFVEMLEKYKHASRYHDFSQLFYRGQCELFIAELEQGLGQHEYLMGERASLVDYALLPFIRQFARVDRKWYLQAPYPKVREWLNKQLQQPLFTKAMAKFPLWTDNHEAFLLGKPV